MEGFTATPDTLPGARHGPMAQNHTKEVLFLAGLYGIKRAALGQTVQSVPIDPLVDGIT